MAAITPQQITEAGIADVTLSSAAAGGDTIAHYANLFLLIINGSAGNRTVTVSEQLASNTVNNGEYGHLTKADASVTIAAGDTAVIGPFAQKSFKDTSGNINITYSDSGDGITLAGLFL